MHAGVIHESVRFPGAAGLLGGELAYPDDGKPAFAALVIGPHPYMGGTMRNALVAAVADELARAGGVSLRFDYAGTGVSPGRPIDVAASMAEFWHTGHAPEDAQRLGDAAAAAGCLAKLGVSPLTVAGYSFGAAAAWRLLAAGTVRIEAAALISPTLARHDFAVPAGRWTPPALLVLHSQDDFCTPAQRVADWVAHLSAHVDYDCLEGGNHFFRGAEPDVARRVAGFMSRVKEVVAC